MTENFKNKLIDWVDFDIAQFYLGVSIGMFCIKGEDEFEDLRKNKWIFWTNNLVGNKLSDMLTNLVDIGYLEYDEKELKFRYNKKFAINKELK